MSGLSGHQILRPNSSAEKRNGTFRECAQNWTKIEISQMWFEMSKYGSGFKFVTHFWSFSGIESPFVPKKMFKKLENRGCGQGPQKGTFWPL